METIPATVGARVEGCEQEACTTLTDMARALCLVTQHDRLPLSRRLRINAKGADLATLKDGLSRPKRVPATHLEKAFTRVFRKSKGYSVLRTMGRQEGWSTLLLAVSSSKGHREYVVAMTGWGEKRPLADVAQTLAELLKAEDL